MSETLRIAPTNATKQTAQDALGTIFSRGVATLVSPFFEDAYRQGLPACLRDIDIFARSKTVWTLSSLWTQRTRPQVTLKTAQTTDFNSAHTDHFFLQEEKNEERTTKTAQPTYPLNRIIARGRNKNGRATSKTKQTKPTVTHVPGLICHPCPRPFKFLRTPDGVTYYDALIAELDAFRATLRQWEAEARAAVGSTI